MSKYINLKVRQITEVTRERNPDDQWDADDTQTSWYPEAVLLTDCDSEHAMPADFDVQVGDMVHVVYAVYSSGDSFCSLEGCNLEILSVHKNEDIARSNAKLAREAKEGVGKDWEENWNITLDTDSGVKLKFHCPWFDYFESLDYVEVYSGKVI